MQLAVIDAEHVLGIHLNTLLTPPPSDPQQAKNLTAEDQARLNRVLEASADMSGYAAIQGTRPQTLAYALTDSPVGHWPGSLRNSTTGPTHQTCLALSAVTGC